MIKDLTPERISEVVTIHERTLPHGPLVQLGRNFLERFYYPTLLKDETFFCKIYEYDHRVAGFISFTTDSANLFHRLMKKHLLLFTRVLLLSLLKNPLRVKSVMRAFWFLRNQAGGPGAHIRAQILSFAVLPEYRSLEFFQQHQVKIANELFNAALRELQVLKVREVKLVTDVKNISNIFYRNYRMTPLGLVRKDTGNQVYWGDVEEMVRQI